MIATLVHVALRWIDVPRMSYALVLLFTTVVRRRQYSALGSGLIDRFWIVKRNRRSDVVIVVKHLVDRPIIVGSQAEEDNDILFATAFPVWLDAGPSSLISYCRAGFSELSLGAIDTVFALND